MLKVPRPVWCGGGERELTFPANWEVAVAAMAGAERPALSREEMERALAAPVGSPPLREVARGRREVVILFDDLTRPTRVAEIIPLVLAELAHAGLAEGHIRFVAALGAHGALTRLDFVQKLGAEVVARFPVYNHNPFANCRPVGTTSQGLPVEVNAEVLACDLKIGLGSLTPHLMAGFGGGGKIILPGVSSLSTALGFHRLPAAPAAGPAAPGGDPNYANPLRRAIAEATRLVGLDFKIDGLLNTRGETAALYAGDPLAAYAAALPEAARHYASPRPLGCQVVVANTSLKANEASAALGLACAALGAEGGDVVLLCDAPEGQVTHYLMGPFGTRHSGPLPLVLKPPPQVRHLVLFSEYPDLAGRGWFEASPRVRYATTWERVRAWLEEWHGAGTHAVVYPNAEVQSLAG